MIINPNSFPKRMTITYIYEVLVSIFSVLIGKKIDSTIMSNFNDKTKEPYILIYEFLNNINKTL